jgi:hypothetical protein
VFGQTIRYYSLLAVLCALFLVASLALVFKWRMANSTPVLTWFATRLVDGRSITFFLLYLEKKSFSAHQVSIPVMYNEMPSCGPFAIRGP